MSSLSDLLNPSPEGDGTPIHNDENLLTTDTHAPQIAAEHEAHEPASAAEQEQPVGNSVPPPPLVKSETTTSARDLIPAFIPVVQVKQEPAVASPVALSSAAILPSTETAPVESRGTKRPAPKSAKKGVAKKAPPTKKQKTDTKAKSKVKGNKSVSMSETPDPFSRRGTASPAVGGSEEEIYDDDEEGSPDADADVYCICKKPDNGTFMIGCDGKCEDWYHGKCVGILEKDKNLIDRYICPICTKKGVGVTTWKRMCRREGCRMPARLAKKDEEPSKYCSDECGVLFFRTQLARTRGQSGGVPGSKKSSRKQDLPEDHGARGGVVNAAELKSLVSSASTFEDFKKLGDGVLSPPATPDPKGNAHETGIALEAYLDESQSKRLAEIRTRKEELRTRHALLKDQAKMINIVRQAGIKVAESKGLKPKDLCGFDDLVQFDEADFDTWRDSVEGQTVLKSGVMEKTRDDEGDLNMQTNGDHKAASGPCMKKKCMKHHDWSKLALETNRSETIENSELMRALEREEGEIRERAGLKARQVQSGDVGGHVVRHALQATPPGDDEKDPETTKKTTAVAQVTPDVRGGQEEGAADLRRTQEAAEVTAS